MKVVLQGENLLVAPRAVPCQSFQGYRSPRTLLLIATPFTQRHFTTPTSLDPCDRGLGTAIHHTICLFQGTHSEGTARGGFFLQFLSQGENLLVAPRAVPCQSFQGYRSPPTLLLIATPFTQRHFTTPTSLGTCR
jgi:hypothetical protein